MLFRYLDMTPGKEYQFYFCCELTPTVLEGSPEHIDKYDSWWIKTSEGTLPCSSLYLENPRTPLEKIRDLRDLSYKLGENPTPLDLLSFAEKAIGIIHEQ